MASNIPSPSPVARSPLDDEEAQRARQAAADEAMASRASAGRGSTIVAGAQIAMDEQRQRLARRAAREFVD